MKVMKRLLHNKSIHHVRIISRRQIQAPAFTPIRAFTAFEQCIGNTPLLYLHSASRIAGCNVYAKAEFMNPGGSVKDRAALWMVKEAQRSGELVENEPGIIVEGTAGNTGIGLALVSKIFGYECVIVIPRTQTPEKKDCLRQSGAKLIEVDAVPYKSDNHYTKIAERLAKNLKDTSGKRVLYANQWDNLANQKAHIQGTGPEIWQQTNHRINLFSCAVGTGGTLSGVGKYLRMVTNHDPNVKICLTDPKGAAIYNYYKTGELKAEGSSISEGIGQGRITGQLKGFAPDYAIEVDDIDMMNVIHALQQSDGLMVGLSSGINVAGAIQCAKDFNLKHEDTVVTLLCDLSTRYVTKQFNIPFLESKNLPIPPWYDDEAATKDERLMDALNRSIV
eukprot:CAMPEP_0202713044 /NCGR_PEP_ID=MMETSP1385-20130828/48964_1 /ASSEMBLY_ACC=CAM_ASM_000861 /TAXON_ID=933848 /ORGANISM="Elphidium margaritaceum" /LENGTH=390 /DNA_ID=CAMNT_0049373273 /DNA_START=48 /DNA_END=1220 /DNA_ORIENTATION=+